MCCPPEWSSEGEGNAKGQGGEGGGGENERTEDESTDQQTGGGSTGEGEVFDNTRKSVDSFKPTTDHPARTAVSTSQLRRAVEEVMGDSDQMANAVYRSIKQNREALRNAMGLDEDFKNMAEHMLDDIESAFHEMKNELEDWKSRTESRMTKRVELNIPEVKPIVVEDQHDKFQDLLFNAIMRLPTVLTGPSGSFKTTSAREVARVLDMPFSYLALGPTQTESKLAGWQNASGDYIPTEFYLRYRYGGVICLDEIDAANPGVLVWANGAIQNRVAAFPRGFLTKLEKEVGKEEAEQLEHSGGMVDMHPDCIIIATANTYGKGADLVYQGRNALDGATLKRFKFILWDYDEVLERKIAKDDAWVDFVQACRASVFSQQMHHIVSPVDSIDGARMIAAGKKWRIVAAETVFASLRRDEIGKILNNDEHQKKLNSLMTTLDKREADSLKVTENNSTA